MPNVDAKTVETLASADPLVLALLVIGMISLGVIWLASLVIKARKGEQR